jgi:3'(2'), 5'-bisphosphate nucleotidase
MTINNLVPDISTPELLEGVMHIARAAAREILAIYATEFTASDKNDRSPLTAADTASHQLISRRLAALTPGTPILSEESADIPYSTRKKWDRYWLVDPLDGTREFIKRNGEFTINIALIERHAPVLGVVQVPARDICYYAARGVGAFKRENDRPPRQIKVKVTSAGSYVVAGSRSHGSDRQNAFIDRLEGKVELLNIGSSLKFCFVAEGLVDIYPRFGPTSEWDTAAAQCVVEQAGGVVVDTLFKPLRYNTGESLINPDFLAIADRDFDWRPYLKQI